MFIRASNIDNLHSQNQIIGYFAAKHSKMPREGWQRKSFFKFVGTCAGKFKKDCSVQPDGLNKYYLKAAVDKPARQKT